MPAIRGSFGWGRPRPRSNHGQSDDWYINEEFDGYSPTVTCESDGGTFGAWLSNFAGTGGWTEINSSQQLVTGGSVYAALVTSTLYEGDPVAGNGDIYVEVKLETTNQNGNASLTCSNGGICPYQVGWVTWNGHFDSTCGSNGCYVFNYFTVKPTVGGSPGGYELGVVYNNGLMQSQRFLSTGGSSYAINTVYDIQIYHANSAQNGPGNYVTVVVNGTTVINGYVDNTCSGGPCMFGGGWTIGPYEEAATVIWSYLYGTRL